MLRVARRVVCIGWLGCLAAVAAGAWGCQGAAGPPGLAGSPGPDGKTGGEGPRGCDGLAPGQGRGLLASLTLGAPRNGRYFTVGEQPVLTVAFKDRCGRTIAPAALRTANLFLYGPRDAGLTTTAQRMLNCVSERPVTGKQIHTEDEQHHFVSLIKPRYADPAQNNKVEAADGTVTYTFAPVSSELPGTYTLATWSRSVDYADQDFSLLDLQIGTPVVEEFVTGPTALSACLSCHNGSRAGRPQMAHSRAADPNPLPSPIGNFAVDAAPIATCKACHNLQGFSEQPLARKIHALHRGRNQPSAGVAHPEYGAPVDPWLADYLDVTFPSMPGAELDCVRCHVDDRWKSKPSRFACGGCHESLFYDTGVQAPPRSFGKLPPGTMTCPGPAACACAVDADCAGFGALVTCDHGSGACVRDHHDKAGDDSGCLGCHSADGTGVSPNEARHEIHQRTRARGLTVDQLAVSGAARGDGVFEAGDVPTLRFRLRDGKGTVVADLIESAALSGNVVVGGPTSDPQRVAFLRLKGGLDGALSFDGGTGLYTFRFGAPLPAQALPPWNTDPGAWFHPNQPGTYAAWLYVNEAFNVTVDGVSRAVRDAGNGVAHLRFGEAGAIRPRQLVLKEACAACHVRMQTHGGLRQVEVGSCALCHTAGAVDRATGSTGARCSDDLGCAGSAAGWERCQDTGGDGKPDTCVMVKDPTPDATIYLPALIHGIHFARLRAGYAERNDLVLPGKLARVGFGNVVTDLSEGLLPVDIRNCTRCHADSGASCSAEAPCGVGQRCDNGSCVNNAWTSFPSGAVCLACHDRGAAYAHAALNTWTDPGTGAAVESCPVCHGPGTLGAVDAVHQIVSPYVPPYDREPAAP